MATDDLPLGLLGPMLGLASDKQGTNKSFPGNPEAESPETAEKADEDATPYPVKTKEPLSQPDNGSSKWAMTDSKGIL